MIPVGEYWEHLPPFNENGLLPWIPDDSNYNLNIPKGSPYLIGFEEFVRVFGQTEHRKTLIRSFLRLRNKLHSIGYEHGVHWVGGSFVESEEKTRSAEPKDMDVVSFMRRPSACADSISFERFKVDHVKLHSPAHTKTAFNIDHFFMDLHADLTRYPEYHYIRSILGWYSLYSTCKRTKERKGFIAIMFTEDLDSSELE